MTRIESPAADQQMTSLSLTKEQITLVQVFSLINYKIIEHLYANIKSTRINIYTYTLRPYCIHKANWNSSYT